MIEIRHLTKQFATRRGPFTALDDVSLTVAAGSIHGVIGLSGAGKSTLIRSINLLERPTTGDIRIDGRSIIALRGAELIRLRRSIGMIFQSFNLLSQRTVHANVAYPLAIAGVRREAIDDRVDELLRLVGLEDKHDAYPAQLSGGQQQRVAIARAMAARPGILLCDEPTSALDIVTTGQILDLLSEINRLTRVTIVLITHEIAVIRRICDHVTVLDGSRVLEQGSVVSVFANPQAAITRQLLLAHEPRESGP